MELFDVVRRFFFDAAMTFAARLNTRTVRLNRFSAAGCATMITAVSAWAFVNSTASSERDPFQFASIMAANAKVRTAQLQSATASTCPNNPEIRDHRAPTCLRG